MRASGDDGGETPSHHLFDDAHIEGLLAGTTGDPALDGFVTALRLEGRGPVPPPPPFLAAVLTGGVCPDDNGDLPVTAASNAHGPAVQVAGLPTRRKKMPVPHFLAAMSLAGKLTLGAGVAAAATTSAGAAGVLPAPVQDAVAGVVASTTPFSLPPADTASSEVVDAVKDPEATEPTTTPVSPTDAEATTTTTADTTTTTAETTTTGDEPAASDEGPDRDAEDHPGMGMTVRDEARAGEVDGAAVSERARQQGAQHRPADAGPPAGTPPLSRPPVSTPAAPQGRGEGRPSAPPPAAASVPSPAPAPQPSPAPAASPATLPTAPPAGTPAAQRPDHPAEQPATERGGRP